MAIRASLNSNLRQLTNSPLCMGLNDEDKRLIERIGFTAWLDKTCREQEERMKRRGKHIRLST